MKKHHEIQDTLERFFHLQAFRPNQEAIIQSVVSGHDVLAVMATRTQVALPPGDTEENSMTRVNPCRGRLKWGVNSGWINAKDTVNR